MEKYVLDLNSEAFSAFKQDFDRTLTYLIASMIERETVNGTINVKFDVVLNTRPVVMDGKTVKTKTSPVVTHKIKAVIKAEHEEGGFIGGNDYEIIWDRPSGKYVMQKIQPSLFDEEDDENGYS